MAYQLSLPAGANYVAYNAAEFRTAPGSFNIWYKCDNATYSGGASTPFFITNGDSNPGWNWYIYKNNGATSLIFGGGAAEDTLSFAMDTGVHMWTVVFDSVQTKSFVYVDATLSATLNYLPTWNASYALQLGKNANNVCLPGKFRKGTYWNTILSQSDITSLYGGGTPQSGSRVADWTLDNTLVDSINGYNFAGAGTSFETPGFSLPFEGGGRRRRRGVGQ